MSNSASQKTKSPSLALVKSVPLDRRIITIRERKVILDAHLAELYGVQTKALNQAVKRNRLRFPQDFVFKLAPEEAEELIRLQIVTTSALRSQTVTSKRRGGRRYLPFAFTEHGALMAATVLNSPRAVAMSLYLVRAFVKMREDLAANAAILKRLAEIDKTLLLHDTALRDIYQKLLPLLQPPPAPPKPEIGFHVKEDPILYRVNPKSGILT